MTTFELGHIEIIFEYYNVTDFHDTSGILISFD